ncbi:MAG: hypothetical protein SF066_04095 [Thermoanaerobaculia bacterium]|nr:hypothetical protein [Thermoanaerobaculia bacterium]
MSDEQKNSIENENFEVTELDDKELDDVAGGAEEDLVSNGNCGNCNCGEE